MWRILHVLAAWCLVGVMAEPGKSVMGELFWCKTLCMCRAKTQVEVQCFDRRQLYSLLEFSERTVRKLEQNNWEMESQVHWCNDLCLCYTRTNAEFRCVKEHYLVQFITDTVGDRYFLYEEEPKEEIQVVVEERPVEVASPVEEDVPVTEERPLETERPLEEGQSVGGEEEQPVAEERPEELEQTVVREQPLEEEHAVEELQTEEEVTEPMELTKRSGRRKNKKNRKPKKVQKEKDHIPPVEDDMTVYTSETTMIGGESEPTTMEHGSAPPDPTIAPATTMDHGPAPPDPTIPPTTTMDHGSAPPDPTIPPTTTTEHGSAPDTTIPMTTTTPSLPIHISAHQSQPVMEEEEEEEEEAELLPKQEAVAASPAVTAMQPPTRRQPFPTIAAATTAAPHTPHTTNTREEPTVSPKVSPVLEVPVGRKTVASEVSQDLEELSSAVMQIKSDVVLNQRILLVTVAAAGIAMLGVLILAVHGCSRRRHPASDTKKKRDSGAKDDNHVTKVNLEEAW